MGASLVRKERIKPAATNGVGKGDFAFPSAS
jgi:hypothetical protein